MVALNGMLGAVFGSFSLAGWKASPGRPRKRRGQFFRWYPIFLAEGWLALRGDRY